MVNLLRIHLDPIYNVTVAKDGAIALDILNSNTLFDLIILDIMLPFVNGWEICETVRTTQSTPILMLTARSEVSDRVRGLELGADDYLIKPFDFEELVARVKALIRRSELVGQEHSENQIITLYNQLLRIQVNSREVFISNQRVELTGKEFELLSKLASAPTRVFTRDVLLDHIWEDYESRDLRLVDTHIKNIRLKLKQVAPSMTFIQTVWGVGYRMSNGEDG
ncbi:hypothetical protein G195_001738 [Phytophthora kernoviae 00238/432]|uniref:Heme response regulator HssR n=1 Tax=Phytophthora kernoviae 00238/432 TaxID=1284355 RepID=A0A8J4SGL3_9STRA|nr:hypothetical protein G195_001738 [Phytophthora kernoviae 00238/432]